MQDKFHLEIRVVPMQLEEEEEEEEVFPPPPVSVLGSVWLPNLTLNSAWLPTLYLLIWIIYIHVKINRATLPHICIFVHNMQII
jgi:hypothetical protein